VEEILVGVVPDLIATDLALLEYVDDVAVGSALRLGVRRRKTQKKETQEENETFWHYNKGL
jgi:hypothetical protein